MLVGAGLGTHLDALHIRTTLPSLGIPGLTPISPNSGKLLKSDA